jgi:hypothetical protein
MSGFPIEYNQDGSPKIWLALLKRSGWHKLNMDGSRKIWMALGMRSGYQMMNMDEKRINMSDFAKSAAKYLFQRHCKKRTNNGDSGIF